MKYTLQDLYEDPDIFKELIEIERESIRKKQLEEDRFYDEIEDYPIGPMLRKR